MKPTFSAAGMKNIRSKQQTDDRQIVREKQTDVHRTHEDKISRTHSRGDQTISRNPPRRRPEHTQDTRRRNEHIVTESPHREHERTYKGTVFDSDFRNERRYDDTRRHDNTVSRNDPRYTGRQYGERYYEMLYRDLLRRYEELLVSRNQDTKLQYVKSNNRDSESMDDERVTDTNSVKSESHKDLRQLCADIDTGPLPEDTRCICSSSMSVYHADIVFKSSILFFIAMLSNKFRYML